MTFLQSIRKQFISRFGVNNKAHPRFVAGYTAGLYDGKLERDSQNNKVEYEMAGLLVAFTGEPFELCLYVAKEWKKNHRFDFIGEKNTLRY